MKKILGILFFVSACIASSAQSGSWVIRMNTKELMAAREENEAEHAKTIKSSEWKKKGFLEISFKEAELNTWKRSFLFFDENDNELLNKENTTYTKIPLSALRKLFVGKKEIRIYTVVAPLDPNIAIRIRRVHLCTLKLP
jgi:hypothetical protein